MSQRNISFTVSIPSDAGFIGRSCQNPACSRYFKVHIESLNDQMHCPYCGEFFSTDALTTADQKNYATEVAKEKALEWMYEELNKALGSLARSTRSSKHVQFKHKPTIYRAKPVHPRYQEREVDSELNCPNCKARFQVYGIFGYCPGCRTENMLIYDANLTIIMKEIEGSDNPHRGLRHAYADLVSTFEIFCKKKAASATTETAQFQDMFEARRFFKKYLGVDIFVDLSPQENVTLRRVFQKRHAYEHGGGEITEKYVKKVPEDRNLLGKKAELSLEEFEQAAQILRRVLGKLIF